MGSSRDLKSGTKAETMEDQHLLACSTLLLIQRRLITLGLTAPTVGSVLSYQFFVLSHRFTVIIIAIIVIMMMMIPKELSAEYSGGSNPSTVAPSPQVHQVDKSRLAITS